LRGATEGENRARITSAIITGLYIAGDDFSKEGPEEGKERARKYLTNPAVNAIATGVTFRPVEGNGRMSERQFIRKDENGIYYVAFNYGEESLNLNIPFDRIGLNAAAEYNSEELWSGKSINIKSPLTIPGKDVIVLKINKK
jgi:alpha-galactosidase